MDAQRAIRILGVTPTSTPYEIKKAYQKEARKTHPDMGGSGKLFSEVQEAFETLKNRKVLKKKPTVRHETLFTFTTT